MDASIARDVVPGRAVRPVDGPARAVQSLGNALLFLIARDEDHPVRWRSASFAAQVATNRAHLASRLTIERLLAARKLLDDLEPLSGASFDALADRLARDPVSVAFAVRAIEIARGVRLPPWPELLRRRLGIPWTEPPSDAELWFG